MTFGHFMNSSRQACSVILETGDDASAADWLSLSEAPFLSGPILPHPACVMAQAS